MGLRDARGALIAVLCGLAVFVSHAPRAEDSGQPRFFSIGTGSTAGTYFPIGALIAAAISRPGESSPCGQGGACGVDNLIATAITTRGSFENLEGIALRRLDSGLAQADIVAWAYEGAEIFTGQGAFPDLRAIANLYPEHVHLVARKGLEIHSLADLRGHKVAIDRDGSGTRINALLIMSAFGVEPGDIETVNAGPELAISSLLEEQIDAAFFVVGYPSAAVAELLDTGRFELVPINGMAAGQLIFANRYYTISSIPAGSYGDNPEIETITVGAQWITHADLPDDLIYGITAALWREENRDLLNAGHAKGEQIRLETALDGLTIPLHPGAKRYYVEKGLISE